MNGNEILADAMARVKNSVHAAVKGLDTEQLATKPYASGNTVAWLLWHLTRIQDDHIADAAGFDQLWTSDGWYERFDLPFEPEATGYGQSPAQVAAVRADAALLLGYHDAVCARTAEWLGGLSLNPTRVPPGYTRMAELETVRERLATYADAGVARLLELS